MDLVNDVQKMDNLAELQSRYVSRIIQHNVQRILDNAMFFGYDLPPTCPFVEGHVPFLDFFRGDIRVRLNGLLRRYELHSGPSDISDRLLTNSEFESLVYWVDYLIDIGNAGAYADVPHILSCTNTWLQTL